MRPFAWIFLLLFAAPALAQDGSSSAPRTASSIAVPQGDHEVVLPLRSGGFGDHYAFPPIRDWKSLRMEFARTACLGTCPDYSVTIQGDGTVRYEGRYCVIAKGARTAYLPQKDVRALFEAFRQADFFSLRDEYNTGLMDAPGIVLSLSYDGWKKRVIDFQENASMPFEASKLPDLIDKIADTAPWVAFPDKDCPRR